MIGYKANAGGYLKIKLDKDANGELLLPPNTTTKMVPEYREGFHLTVVGRDWEYVENEPLAEESLEEAKGTKLIQFGDWESAIMERAFIYETEIYVNDAKFREMISSVIQAHALWGRLPGFFITGDKSIIQKPTIEYLDGLAKKSYDDLELTMAICFRKQEEINSSKSKSELNKIEFIYPPTVDELKMSPTPMKVDDSQELEERSIYRSLSGD